MSNPPIEQQTDNPSGTATSAGHYKEGDGERSFTQAEVDRIIADRLKREDVKGLKAKAAQLDQITEQQKTAEEKAAEQLKAAERTAADAEAKAIRYQVAADNGISKADADLFLTGGDEDTITAQAKRLLERDADRKKQGNYVPNEGKKPTNGGQDDQMREFTRGLFDRED